MSWLHTWDGYAGWEPWWDLALVAAAAGALVAIRLVIAAHDRWGSR
jgi:hypothetical protein